MGSRHTTPAELRTRPASAVELAILDRALDELEAQRLEVALLPAPEPRFDGQKVRAAVSHNPEWYRLFLGSRGDDWAGSKVHRGRVVRALRRALSSGMLRGNGYEKPLLGWLKVYYSRVDAAAVSA